MSLSVSKPSLSSGATASRLVVLSLFVLGSGCAKVPSSSCERTLTCTDAATVAPAPDCQWILGPVEAGVIPTWDDGPAFTDAGLWLWNGRTVEVNASCTLPEPPSPPDAVVRLDASTPAPDLPDPPPADAGPEAPEPDAAPPIPPPSTADAGPTDAGS